MRILCFASQLINVALGKCISIRNTTAILEDCDGSSKVRWAGVFSLIVGIADSASVVDRGRVWHLHHSLETFFLPMETIIIFTFLYHHKVGDI